MERSSVSGDVQRVEHFACDIGQLRSYLKMSKPMRCYEHCTGRSNEIKAEQDQSKKDSSVKSFD